MTHATTVPAAAPVPAVVPLALLEAVRGLDRPPPDALDEFHPELSTKRLGLNRTVALEIERLQRMGPRGRVSAGELGALLRLVARRQDAALVFSEAGRGAARYAFRRLSVSGRAARHLLPRPLRARLGFGAAARLSAQVLGIRLVREAGGVVTAEPAAGAAPPERGSACTFYGAAVAELLRLLTDFDGAMVHVACLARGGVTCRWRSARAASEASPS
ncbi:MAG TPA: hypothetical protein VFH97_10335 [Gemmatimonadales bacterium]|nr:hypothetical protein [Gemmatimonadales bacterium]